MHLGFPSLDHIVFCFILGWRERRMHNLLYPQGKKKGLLEEVISVPESHSSEIGGALLLPMTLTPKSFLPSLRA